MRPLLFGSIDLAQVVDASLDLRLGLSDGLGLLGLSRCLHCRIPELFGLCLRGLRLRLGRLDLAGELLILVAQLTDFIS